MLLFAQIYGIIHTIRDVIALKEANETGKWLEMLLKTDYIDEATYNSIDKTCSTICILLIASIKTAKGNSK